MRVPIQSRDRHPHEFKEWRWPFRFLLVQRWPFHIYIYNWRVGVSPFHLRREWWRWPYPSQTPKVEWAPLSLREVMVAIPISLKEFLEIIKDIKDICKEIDETLKEIHDILKEISDILSELNDFF